MCKYSTCCLTGSKLIDGLLFMDIYNALQLIGFTVETLWFVSSNIESKEIHTQIQTDSMNCEISELNEISSISICL